MLYFVLYFVSYALSLVAATKRFSTKKLSLEIKRNPNHAGESYQRIIMMKSINIIMQNC